jgi:hypothetical protein
MNSAIEMAVLHLKRGDGRLYQFLRTVYRYCLAANLPVPDAVKPSHAGDSGRFAS